MSQNKQLCSPASVDTIDSSNGQEDHVSMGANAATKALRVFENYQKVMGIEMLSAAQAADLREGNSSKDLMHFLQAFRKEVAFIQDDRVLHYDMEKSKDFLA